MCQQLYVSCSSIVQYLYDIVDRHTMFLAEFCKYCAAVVRCLFDQRTNHTMFVDSRTLAVLWPRYMDFFVFLCYFFFLDFTVFLFFSGYLIIWFCIHYAFSVYFCGIWYFSLILINFHFFPLFTILLYFTLEVTVWRGNTTGMNDNPNMYVCV